MNEIDSKTKEIESTSEISRKLFQRVFLPWTAILILLHLLSIYVAPAYLWGAHFYHFFPVWIGWVLTLAALAILIPGISEFLYVRFEAFGEKIKKPLVKLGENKTFLLLSLLSLPFFWVFRVRLYLLGDGYFRIQDLTDGKLHLQEWLDGFIHLELCRMMTKLIPSWTAELTYSIMSILCGGVFVFISLKLSSFLGKNGFQKVLIFVFLISLGSIQLFFGYVESYTILQVVLLTYIWFSARYLSGQISIYPVLLTFVISIGLHISSLIFLPSFIYLLWESQDRKGPDKLSSSPKGITTLKASFTKRKSRLRKKSPRNKSLLSVPILITLVISLIVILFWIYKVATGLEKTGKGIFILPLRATETFPFSMFCLAHVSEFVNQLLLLSPLGISLILFFLFLKLRYWHASKGFTGLDKLTSFLILASLFAFIYLFIFNFTLGSADWDLRSSPAPFFGLLGVILFLKWGEELSAVRRPSTSLPSTSLREGEQGRTLRTSPPPAADQSQTPVREKVKVWDMKHTVHTWGVVFICFSLFHTVPWVLINANPTRSLNRYTLIQESDPHPVDEAGYNLYKVTRILSLAGLPEEIEKVYQRATERNPYDTLSYYNLAAIHHKKRDFDQAMYVLDTLQKIDPLEPKANWMRGDIYVKRGEYEKALPYLEKAFPFFADNPEPAYLFDLGTSYYKTNQIEAAGICAQQMIKIAPEYTPGYHILALVYAATGDYEHARKAWEYILTLTPNDTTATQNLQRLESYKKK
jgi:Flp pilus assembly protein TadD